MPRLRQAPPYKQCLAYNQRFSHNAGKTTNRDRRIPPAAVKNTAFLSLPMGVAEASRPEPWRRHRASILALGRCGQLEKMNADGDSCFDTGRGPARGC